MQGRIPVRSACRRSGRFSLRFLARSQSGAALIEIMMSALLVALAATAVFKGIDGATATSGQSKSRAVAVTLAQEDQERMRSMDPRKLAAYNPGPRTKTVNRISYTITSTADWVSDRGDSESCTKGDGRVTYVKISSKVEWPDMRSSKPVVAASIVSINNAYAKGSLAVKIVDRTGSTGVPNIPVSVDPPVSLTKNTNDAGCVVFDGLDAGQYFGQFSKIGYVDPNGTNVVRPAAGWNVTTGSTSIATYQYDLAGQINFAFDTKYQTNPAWDVTSMPAGIPVTVLHQNIPGPPTQGQKITPNVVTGSAGMSYGPLFPFQTPYTAFAGTCVATAPAWTTPSSATVPPAGTVGLKLRMPAIGVKVQRNGATPTGTIEVTVRPSTGSCVPVRILPNATSSNSYTTAPTSSTASSYAFPAGSYIVCADDNVSTGNARKAEVTVNNTSESGSLTTVNITQNTATASGQCPE
jgi:Tfp pilus assembly protein PilV